MGELCLCLVFLMAQYSKSHKIICYIFIIPFKSIKLSMNRLEFSTLNENKLHKM